MTPDLMVLGGDGMIGHKVVQVLAARFGGLACTVRRPLPEAVASHFRSLHVEVLDSMEFEDWPACAARIAQRRPAWIVNCVGVVKQRPEARLPLPSIAINALLPHRLLALGEGWGGRLLQFSTDCVFSGSHGAYDEDSRVDAEDLYGRSKHLGEIAGAGALTLRTSAIGRELRASRSLLEWLLSCRGGRVSGFSRVMYSGVTTRYLAELIATLVADRPQLSGLYHVAGEPISKFELLLRLREAWGLEVDIVEDATVVCDRTMSARRFRAATGLAAPGWTELVRGLRDDPTPYEEWRGGSDDP